MISKGANLDSNFKRLIFSGFHPSIIDLFLDLSDEFPNSKTKIDFLKYCKTKFKTRGVTYWTNLMLEHCYCIKNNIKKTKAFFDIEFGDYSIKNFTDEEVVIILGESTNQKLLKSNLYGDGSYSIEYLKSQRGKNEIFLGRQKELEELINKIIPSLILDEEATLELLTKENSRKGRFSYNLINEQLDLNQLFNKLKGEYISEDTEYKNFKLIFENINLSLIANPIIWKKKYSYLIEIFKILLESKIIESPANPKYVILNQLFVDIGGNEFKSVTRQQYHDVFTKNLSEEVIKTLNLLIETSIIK